MTNRYKEAVLDKNTFSITWEVVPGRGAWEKAQELAVETAGIAAKDGRIHGISITDMPGGSPAMLADELGRMILAQGIEPVVHFTCKDRNRNQAESQLYSLDRSGVRNILVMTGDYQGGGTKGLAKPVFDYDPVHLLGLVKSMNEGLEYPGMKGTIKNKPSDFFAGCAVSPFKQTEAEQMVQYFKLRKKIEAGAQFIIPQLGYDMRKVHELLQFVRTNFPDIPLIGNLYILPYGAANLMNRNGLAGCVVTDKMLAQLAKEKEAEDKGVGARIDRAAKMFGIMKGMGYDGVDLGGHNIKYEWVDQIITDGEKYYQDWEKYLPEFDFPMDNGFYYYEKNPANGLNTEKVAAIDPKNLDTNVPFVYRLSRFVHKMMFDPHKWFNGMMTSISKAADGTAAEKPYHAVEHIAKVMIYDCKDCGDCALPNTAYTCPMAKCPKNQRNGACGGSRDGWCEVYPGEMKCIYVKAYSRLKNYGKQQTLNEYIVPPVDWKLYQTSGWINFFLGRDHDAKRLGIPTVPKKTKKK